MGLKSIGYTVKEELSQETKNILEKLNNQEQLINYRKLNFKEGNNIDYDFTNSKPLIELFRAIYYGEILISAAEREQDEFDYAYEEIKIYKANKPEYKKKKTDLLVNAKNVYERREMIINAFKNKTFPLNYADDTIFHIVQKKIHKRLLVLANLISLLSKQKKSQTLVWLKNTFIVAL